MNEITTAGPVTAAERIVSLDVLRGFALLGILLVNIAFFAHPVSDAFNHAGEGGVNGAIAWLTAFFAQGKFYPLFSLLFGLGFAVQLERARRRGGSFVPAYLRRLLVLLAIGVLHGVFIWAGDILTMYAVLGFLLLLLGLGRPGWLLGFSITAFVLQLLIAVGAGFAMQTVTMCEPVLEATSPEQTAALDPAIVQACSAEGMAQMQAGFAETEAEMLALREAAWTGYTTGSYSEVTAVRAQEFGMMISNMGFLGLQVLAMFLFGGWLGKREIFSKPHEHKRFLRIVVVLAIFIGAPLSAWFANISMQIDPANMLDPAFMWAFVVNLFAGPLLALGYAGTFMLAMQTRASRGLRVLAPVGRMALTNYLAQSVICTLIFYSYGFGLMAAEPGPLAMLGIVAAVFVVEVFWSHWWLNRFAFGPMEWVWRALTYFHRPRMRLAPSHA
ncbi:MAG TPA: DUF418 domain-containing protein [Gammaproteobacteria bacterium]